VRLLIVDDSSEIRAALRKIAEQQDHVVVGEAENGKQALRLFPQAQPDMVLLDVSMPVMGGFATARELRQRAPELPIVFISQHADDDYVSEAFRLGARGYLLKSAIYSELSQAIETVANQQKYRSVQLGA
jgi:two-component system, NarL family, invasion response regulator UvrY